MTNRPFTATERPPGCQQSALCPLNQVCVGRKVRIKQLAVSADVSHRLREMGFCEEQQIKLVSRESNVICQICNVRLGISDQLASSIWVELLPTEGRSA